MEGCARQRPRGGRAAACGGVGGARRWCRPGNTSAPLFQWPRLRDGNSGLCPGSAHASHCHRRPQARPLASSGPACPLEPSAAPSVGGRRPGRRVGSGPLPLPQAEGEGCAAERRSQSSDPRAPAHPPCGHRSPAPWLSSEAPSVSCRLCSLAVRTEGRLRLGMFWRWLSLTRRPAWPASERLSPRGQPSASRNGELPPGPGQ